MVRITMGGLLPSIVTTSTASAASSSSPPTDREEEAVSPEATALRELSDSEQDSEDLPQEEEEEEEIPPTRAEALTTTTARNPEYLLSVKMRGAQDGGIDGPPYYCVFLVKQFGGHNKNEANIKISDDPYGELVSQNLGSAPSSPSASSASGAESVPSGSGSAWPMAKANKSRWQIEGIVCPLLNREECDELRSKWMRSSRGLASRREHGVALVEEFRRTHPDRELFFFDKRLVPLDPNQYLRSVDLEHLAINEERFRSFLTALAATQ
jgi:hypothetical protein